MNFLNVKITLTLFLVFLIVGCLTLPGYGINWDTINHLPRGQAYLHYFLIGKEDYSDLPVWEKYYQNPDSLLVDTNISKEKAVARSFYQSDATPFSWFMTNDGNGHPPLSDILSSVFNVILFQKVGLINDIDSYHVYGIFLAALLVGLLYFWVSKIYGKFAGLVSAASLLLYPLFWSEAHFNTEKDVPETVYWSFFLFCIWQGFSKKSYKWLTISGLFFFLALGTKFNILFALPLVAIWFGTLVLSNIVQKREKIKEQINYFFKPMLVFGGSLILGTALFIASWPYLWPDPIDRIGKVLKFYKGIGLTTNVDPNFLGPLGANTYPLQWIFYTTPPVVLFFFIVGLFFALKLSKKETDKISWLFLLWFLVPVLRITWPGTTVYGGIRQIMEYIPAMAVIAGIGAAGLRGWIVKLIPGFKKNPLILASLIMLSFAPIAIRLVQIHPNENVYFNVFVGGLAGAKARDLPSWGNTFGAAYREGFSWLDKNAEKGSTVAFAFELYPNFPMLFIRPDIELNNRHRSGILRGGEYAITLTYQGIDKRSYYDTYLERFLDPVYQSMVDGVAVVKVWKNDATHTRPGYIKEASVSAEVKKDSDGFQLDLKKSYYLTKIVGQFDNKNCANLSYAYSETSEDGVNWQRQPGTMPKEDWNTSAYGEQPTENQFIEPFAADKARFIRFKVSPVNACLENIKEIKVFYLEELN